MDPQAGWFAKSVLSELRRADGRTSILEARARGNTATIGLKDGGDWIPMFRLTHPSSKFNVMNLEVRHRNRWASTLVRGVPAQIAETLLGPLRHIWEFEIGGV